MELKKLSSLAYGLSESLYSAIANESLKDVITMCWKENDIGFSDSIISIYNILSLYNNELAPNISKLKENINFLKDWLLNFDPSPIYELIQTSLDRIQILLPIVTLSCPLDSQKEVTFLIEKFSVSFSVMQENLTEPTIRDTHARIIQLTQKIKEIDLLTRLRLGDSSIFEQFPPRLGAIQKNLGNIIFCMDIYTRVQQIIDVLNNLTKTVEETTDALGYSPKNGWSFSFILK